jgi:AraC-like DNA-binding protein
VSLIEKRRQEIVSVLETRIVPALRLGTPQVYLDFPLQQAPAVRVTRLTERVLAPGRSRLFGPPVTQHWPGHALLTHDCPCFAFLFEGGACERTGLTRERARQLRERRIAVQPGTYALHLQAPCAVYYPPGMPHSDGTRPLCEPDNLANANYRLLWFHIFRTEVLVHLDTTTRGVTQSTPGLQLRDRNICLLFEVYAELLNSARLPPQETTAAALSTIMLVLRDKLRATRALPANFSWPQTPPVEAASGNASPRLVELCNGAVQYIQLHLNEKLTLQRIAAHGGVSCQHLNLAFHRVLNTTAMRYLTHQRIETAKRIMETEPWLSLKEIALRSGFANAASFNNAFVREVRVPPGEYRRRLGAE